MSEDWRLFIALKLPPETLKALGKLQTLLKKEAPDRVLKWVAPEKIHLTLKFLGDTPVSRIDAVKDGVAKAAEGQRGFLLDIGRLGCFPNVTRPRVLWVGVSGETHPLMALQNQVETFIAPLGFPSEARKFSPHLTLARVKRQARTDEMAALASLVEAWEHVRVANWKVDAVTLIRSQLTREGPIYTDLFHAGMGPPA